MIIGPGIRLGPGIQLFIPTIIDPAWDLSYAKFSDRPPGRFSVAAEDTVPSDIFFKPDGTKMYVLGAVGDAVNEYNLSTAWNVVTASYVQNFSVAAQETNPNGVFFKPDGTKMYVVGTIGDDVNEYNLSAAWNVATASYVQNVSVAAQELTPTDVFFKPDGTKMYIIGTAGDDVNEYNLSAAWNVATASYVQNVSVAAQETAPTGISFKPEGDKMYIIGSSGDDVNEYDLSIAWNVATRNFVRTFSVAAQEISPQGIFFKPEGDKMYIIGTAGDAVNEYDLSTAWNLATASYTIPLTNYFSVRDQETLPTGIFFKPDGTKMYVVGTVGDDVNEYDLSTAWNVETASYVQNVSIAAQETVPQDVFFKPEGDKMYILGSAGDDVNEYNLSAAWNVATASYVQNVSVAAQETIPTGIFFKPEGDKMYIVGDLGDAVNEYNLSTPWNVATASYVQNVSVAAQETVPQGVFFKPEGDKMYIIGQSGQDVNEYNLSAAWNVATASYVQNFSINIYELIPNGIFFKPDGTKMYITGQTDDAVWSFDIKL